MTFVSYAQNFEDVMLWRALKHVESGFYIDVGANDPEIDSVTKAFYDRGWRGINIEPVAQWFQRLEEQRPRDVNLQVAAGAKQGELTIYELPDTGLSTMDKATAERHEAELGYAKAERLVPVETLTSVCRRLHMAPIHFLKIDVEGAEKDVLEGLDLSIIRPWIIVVESTLPNTQIEDYEEWEPILCDANYELAYFDGLNRYYISDEHRELKAYFDRPPNVFDGFALSGTASHPFCNFLESKKQEQEERAVAAEALAAEQEERAVAAEALAAEQEERAAAAEALTAEQEERAVAAEALAVEQEERAAAAEALAAEQESRIEELAAQAHHWRQQAGVLEAERDALRQSWSWRITGPLRWVWGIPLRAGSGIRRAANHAVSHTINTCQRPLAKLMSAVLQNPTLSHRINQRLLRYPALHQQLLGIARRRGVIPGTPTQIAPLSTLTMPEIEALDHLTPRARRIYSDLKAAIESGRKENG